MDKATLIRNCYEIYFEKVIESKNGKDLIYIDDRTKTIDHVAHVYPVGISNSQVYIICPYCKKIHTHGLAGGDYEGYREPHCVDNTSHKGIYYIERA